MIDCKPPERIYNQYRRKPKAVDWLNLSWTVGEQICDASNAVKNSYDIDSNEGEQLDVIGRIVVADREYADKITLEVYQLNTDGDYQCGDESVQCSETSVASDSKLSDEYYRLLLKAKIAKNNSDATSDSILAALKTIAPEADFQRVVNGQNMTMSVEFYGEITPIQRQLLVAGELVPVPQGVLLSGILEGIGIVQCNDQGDFQCGDESAQCVGFIGV